MRPVLRRLEDLRPLVTPHKNEAYCELLNNIKKRGEVYCPLVTTEGGLVVDGCRRYEILREIGKSVAPANIIEDELSEDEIWDLRAELNVLHRSPSPGEIRRFSGQSVSSDRKSSSISPELELLIQDILAAKGFGPRILQAIANKTRVVLPDLHGSADVLEEVMDLANIDEDPSWK